MAGLLLCIIAIFIGFSYTPHGQPEPFSPYLALGVVVLCALASLAAGVLTSMRFANCLRDSGSQFEAAVVFARWRRLSWLLVLSLYGATIHLYHYSYLITGKEWLGLDAVPFANTILILTPFFLSAAGNLAGLYRGETLLRGGSWNIYQYEAFYLRQFLVPVLPFMVLLGAHDTVAFFPHVEEYIYVYRSFLTAAFAVYILLLFTFAPLLFRLLWKVERLPDGPLRSRVEQMAASSDVRYRDIYIWRTGGSNMVNAMVTGIFAPLRYIFVTDALLTLLPEEEAAAVLAHELGHAKHRHMQTYAVLAVSFIAFMNSTQEMILGWLYHALGGNAEFVLGMYVVALMVLFWGFVFGFTSRRLEQAADAFAAHKVSPRVFGAALERIALLSGGSRSMRSWRHFPIDRRVQFMQEVESLPAGGALERSRRGMKVALGIMTVILLLGAGTFAYTVYADAAMSPATRYEHRFRYAWYNERYDYALDIADAAIEAQPEKGYFCYLRAETLIKLKRLEEAEAMLRKAIEMPEEGDKAKAEKADYYCVLAELLEKLSRLEEAESALRKAVELDPEEEEYWKELEQIQKKIEARRKSGALRGDGDSPAE